MDDLLHSVCRQGIIESNSSCISNDYNRGGARKCAGVGSMACWYYGVLAVGSTACSWALQHPAHGLYGMLAVGLAVGSMACWPWAYVCNAYRQHKKINQHLYTCHYHIIVLWRMESQMIPSDLMPADHSHECLPHSKISLSPWCRRERQPL